ncbi:hypothetical protein Tco_0716192 [Tanacetum coccineum]
MSPPPPHYQKQASATQEEPSDIDTFFVCTLLKGVFNDPEALRMKIGLGSSRRRVSTTAENQRRWSEAECFAGTFLEWVRFADAFARYDSGGASGSGGSRARDSEGGEDGDDTGREDGGDDTIRSFPSDMSLGNLVPPWHQFLDQKIRGAHFSLGIVAGERFVIELTPSMFPQRHVAGDTFPSGPCRWGIRFPSTCRWRRCQNVAGERVDHCSVHAFLRPEKLWPRLLNPISVTRTLLYTSSLNDGFHSLWSYVNGEKITADLSLAPKFHHLEEANVHHYISAHIIISGDSDFEVVVVPPENDIIVSRTALSQGISLQSRMSNTSDKGTTFGDGAARVGMQLRSSPKVSTSSPLVSPSTIINVPRELYSIDVAATFGVPLTTVGDLQKLINDIDVGKHDELLSELTNEDRMETLEALVTICNSIKVDRNNADVIPCKVSYADDSINLNVDESTIPSDPIVQSVDINKSTSYVGVAGGSAKDQPNVNSNFRTLVADPVFDGVNNLFPRKLLKMLSNSL